MKPDFSYIDVAETNGEIVIWGRKLDGTPVKQVLPISDFLYCFTPSNSEEDTGYTDIYGAPLKKVLFDSKWDLREYSKERDHLCESDVSPSYKLLLDLMTEAPQNAPYATMLYDIEVDFDLSDGKGYPLPSNPFGEINSFQFIDVMRNEYHLFYVCDTDINIVDEAEGLQVHITKCKDEKEILFKVADYLDYGEIDIMAGWYSDSFDLPYMIARAEILFGESYAKKMFCRDGFSARKREFVDDFGNNAVNWTLVGRQHLDMMELYKKFIPSEKKSFSLSNVCIEDLGEDKIDYDGDLGELYRVNPVKFFQYALKDAQLLKWLDEKHQIIRLAVTLARMNCVKFADVTGAVKPIEHGIMKFAHRDGIRLPDKRANTKEKFEGAIVYDTIAGRHGWVSTIDLGALYPSVMQMLGLSPETLVLNITEGYDGYIAVMSRSDTLINVEVLDRGVIIDSMQMEAYELEAIIRERGYCIAASGAIFNGGFGLMAKFVKSGIDARNKYKKMMKDAIKSDDTYNASLYDLYQKVIKIGNNSVYGATGEASFRLFDLRLSRSITLTSRVISKWQAYKSNDIINQLK